jgi:hypothetical protein
MKMANVEELLYLETDASCACCGLRDNRALTIHHLEQSEPKNESYDNKILLCHNCHQCHHQDKGPTAVELREIKRRLIVKTLTRPGLNALKEADRRTMVVAIPFLVNHLVEMGYLEFKEKVQWEVGEGGQELLTLATYSISDPGRTLLQEWQLK